MDEQGQEKKRSAFLATLDYGMLALYQVAAFVAIVLPASVFYPLLKAVAAGIYYAPPGPGETSSGTYRAPCRRSRTAGS